MLKSAVQTSFFLSLLCFTSIGYTDSSRLSKPQEKEAAPCGTGGMHKRLTARHIEGKGVGYNQGYSTLEAFLAPEQELGPVMPFLDVRAHIFDNGKFAANAGIGLRGRRGCRAYGGNIYYDYRDSKRSYNQIGVGLESLGQTWDFRLNGYFPVGNKISHPYRMQFSHFKDNRLILSRKYEFTMKGADAEAGAHFGCSTFDFFAGAGPYYFDGEKGPHAWGGKGRILGQWKEYIGLQLSASYDNVFHGIVQGEISFNIPLKPKAVVKARKKYCAETCQMAVEMDKRMVQPVVRDEIIVLNKRREHSVAINPATGDPFVFWFVDNTSHSAGTFESPFNTLIDAQNASKTGDIIYVFPGDLTSTGMSSGITLKNAQQLLGATVNHRLKTTVGTLTIPSQASGSFLPLLTNTSGPVVTLANDNLVSGFYIQNLHGDGIYGSGINNATATQNFITGSGSYYGIEMDNATGTITIANNSIGYEASCVYIDNILVANATYLLTDNNLSNSEEDYAVYVTDVSGSNNTYTFSNNLMQGYDYGLYLYFDGTTSNCTIKGNSISFYDDYGIYFDMSSSNITATIDRNSLSGPYYLIYTHSAGSSTFSGTISNNTFMTNADDAGLYLDTDTSSASYPDLAISNNTFVGGYSGIYLDDESTASSSITISNNIFSYSAYYGIDINGESSGNLYLGIEGNTFQGCGTNAVLLNQTGAGTTCVELKNNAANLFPDAYQLTQSAGTVHLVTPAGNLGQVVQTGAITIVPSCQ